MPRQKSTETVGPRPLPIPLEPLSPGYTLDSRYEIRGLLGTGGYGLVYDAFDQTLKQPLALKLLRPDRYAPRAIARLAREVRVAREAQHPRLIRIYDFEEGEHGAYLAMEVVRGGSLGDRLTMGSLATEEAVRVAIEILEGLAYLHSLGIVHRDVKPENVLFTEEGAVKLGDFGLARRLEQEETALTRADGLVGTFAYLAPEVLSTRAFTPASDCYAVGVVLFEMLTGRKPHESDAELGGAPPAAEEPVSDLRTPQPDIPSWLARVVARLLEPDPRNRYQTAAAVLTDLRAQRSPRRRLRRPHWIVVAVFLSLLALAALWFMWGRERHTYSDLVKVGKDGIAAVGTEGETLWQLSNVDPDVISRASTVVRISPHGKPLLAIIPHPRANWSEEDVETLRFLDPETGAEERRMTLPSMARFFPGIPKRFRPDVMRAIDLNHDGADEILISYIYTLEYPSFTLLVEPRAGRVRELFYGSGHHRIAGAEDLDGDGRPEILLAGINNHFGWVNALAAVRVNPWLGEPGEPQPTTSPDTASIEENTGDLLWYTLLPRGTIADRSTPVTIDRARRRLVVKFARGAVAEVGYDGFLTDVRYQRPVAERSRARQQAFFQYREAERLRRQGRPELALREAEEGLAFAREAEDARLAEVLERLVGQLLILCGRIPDAEQRFEALVEQSENASEIAFDAAEVLHREGHLTAAARWYEQGLEAGGSQEAGKSKQDFAMGELFALVELERYDDAELFAERFARAYPAVQQSSLYEEFVRWQRGAVPRLERVNREAANLDLYRYWLLEFRLARGEPLSEILAGVEQELAGETDVRPELLSLKGEISRRLGRVKEAALLLKDAREGIEAARPESTVARAHTALVNRRWMELPQEIRDAASRR